MPDHRDLLWCHATSWHSASTVSGSGVEALTTHADRVAIEVI